MYNLAQAAKQLGLPTRRLYYWKAHGQLNPITKHLDQNQISDTELQTIHDLITPPKDGLTVAQLAQHFQIAEVTVKNIIQTLHLMPAKAHITHQISTNTNYYDKSVLTVIGQYLLKTRQTGTKRLSLIPNTDRKFNQQIDLTSTDLLRELDISINNTSLIYQWINGHHFDGLYSIDEYGKLFFTPDQTTQIKSRFRHIPDNVTYSQPQLAKKLHMNFDQLYQFRKGHHIPVVKILGYKEVFYTNEMANKIIELRKHLKG